MPRKMKYEVRVYRRIEEEYVDIEVSGTSMRGAENTTLKEVTADPSRYFGAIPDPYYDADVPHPLFGTGEEVD